MQKAAEDLKRQQEKEAAEKKAYIEKLVPKLEIDGLADGTTPRMSRHCASLCMLLPAVHDGHA